MMMKRIFTRVCMLMACMGLGSAIVAGNDTAPAETNFSIAELKGHMYFLASDFLNGRVTGESGYDIAARYVESQFKQAGLLPFVADSTGDSLFMQNFNLKRNDYYADSPVEVFHKQEKKTFRLNKDFKITNVYPGDMDGGEKEVIFLGYGIEEPEESWNDLENIDIKNKIVMVLNGAPVKNGKAVLPHDKQQLYSSLKGLNRKLVNLILKQPAAIMLVQDEMLLPYFNKAESNVQEFSIEYDGEDIRTSLSDVMMRLMIIKPEMAAYLLKETRMDLADFAEGKLRKYKTGSLPQVRINMEIRKEERIIEAANVVGFVYGTDPVIRDEFIVIGAHLDHVPNFKGAVNNGADDNASGVSLIMELAEEIAANPLKRTVIFVAYTGEEGGLHGSRHFLKVFPHKKEQIAAALNFDCVGRNGRNATERFETYILDAAGICPDMIPLVEEINARSANFHLVYEMENRQGTSDQESFINEGIPVVDFFNGGTADLHTSRDEVEKIDWEYLQRMCILGQAVAEKLGNLQERMCEMQE